MSYDFGDIFAEEISKGKKRRIIGQGDEDNGNNLYTGRFLVLVMVFIFGIGMLLAKLFSVTIITGTKYKTLSTENRIRETKILAPRGIIYDRTGVALVRNIPVFIASSDKIFFESVPSTYSGKVKESIARDYIYKEDTAHVLGYIGEVSEDEMKLNNSRENAVKLEPGDIVGKMGIEQYWDDLLRGHDGKELIEVDASGAQVRTLGNLPPVPGRSMNLSIEANLQKIAKEQMTGVKGAVVAEDPKTGQVLLLYSSPSFDPNRLVRSEAVAQLLSDPNHPFFDRTIAGLYPPGSTFKIVTATAALQTGAITRDTKIEDTGILQVGQFSFGNWYFLQYGRKEGILDIVSAIKRSNDIFFYKTGEATGINNLSLWAKKMGLGSALGIDVNGEAAGVMPDPAWREKVTGTKWYLGDTYHVAIGQGDLQVTPLQINAWTNVIANGGKLCRPHLLLDQKTKIPASPAGRKDQSEYCKDLGIKKETIDLIKEGMKEVCSPGGTGWPLFNFAIPASTESGKLNSKINIDGLDFTESPNSTISAKRMIGISTACKTGTAEFGDPQNRTHALFTVFAPVSNPQISVTVLVEEAGEGSNVAAPIAKKILEGWFEK